MHQTNARPGEQRAELSDAPAPPHAARNRPAGPEMSRFDPHTPHPARVYSYWLGGKDHYPADRMAADEVIRLRPQVVAGARANRAFLARAVRYLAGQRSIRQFLDIGTGLPAPDSTHTVAQAIAPQSRVVYIDNDHCKSGCAHPRRRRHMTTTWADASAHSPGRLGSVQLSKRQSR